MATNAIKLYSAGDEKRVSINYDIDKEEIPSQALVVNGSTLIRGKDNNARDAAVIFTPYAVTNVVDTDYSPGSIVFKEANNLSRFAIYQYSRTSTEGTTYSNYNDAFYLPDTGVGKSTNDGYKILTTKSVNLSPAELTRVQSMLGITSIDTSVFVRLSGAQTIAGRKTFTDVPLLQNGNRYVTIRFASKKVTSVEDDTYGPASIYVDFGSDTDVRKNQFWFYQYSPTETSGYTTFTRYRDAFYLPETSAKKTGNDSYQILTSKSPVTVAQGGTGATTAAGARTALGLGSSATHAASTAATGDTVALRNSSGDITGRYLIGTWLQTTEAEESTSPTKVAVLGSTGYIYYATPANVALAGGGATQLYSGTFTSGSANVTLTNGKSEYNYLLLVGMCGSTSSEAYNTCLIPVAALSTTATGWQCSSEVAYIGVNLIVSDNNIIMAFRSRQNSNCAIKYVYGIK